MNNTDKLTVRKAVLSDLERLTDIYNQAIESGKCTCDTKALTADERKSWFYEHQSSRFPLYSCTEDGNVIGYISLSPYKQREALKNVAEVTYYLDFDYRRKGIGTFLLSFITDEAKKLGFSDVIAVIVGCNEASAALLKKSGFTEWGRMPKIADYDGRLEDHVYFGKHIKQEEKL